MGPYSNFISRATVLNSPELTSGEKLLLIVLRANQSWKNGECSPTREELARSCNVVDNTLDKWRQGLKSKGLIDWTVKDSRCYYVFPPKSVSKTALPPHLMGNLKGAFEATP